MSTPKYCPTRRTSEWDDLEELSQISELLTYVLDLGESSRAAQLFGVSKTDTALHMTSLCLDPNDPVGDLWGLVQTQASHPELFDAHRDWAWVIVTCETEPDSYLAIAVSKTGKTIAELRTPGQKTFRSRLRATGRLVDTCNELLTRGRPRTN